MYVTRSVVGRIAPAGLVGLVLLGGCSAGGSSSVAASSDGGSGSAATASTPSTPAASPSVSATASLEPAPTSTAAITGQPVPAATGTVAGTASASAAQGPGAAVVQAIRVAGHGTFDRVVVEFHGSFAGWRVGYVDKVTNDPEGSVVPLKGSAFIDVRIDGATYDNLFQVGPGVPHLSFAGPHRLTADLPNLKEIADSGDFEAVIGLGLGVDHKAALRAYRLENPTRLVIDVAH